MEGAVSAYAVNSKWLGLGLGRPRGVLGRRKQNLLLSMNGLGCSRKNNCIRFRPLEWSWIGMGPRGISRQRLKLKGRFVMAGSAACGTGSSALAQGDDGIENIVVPVAASAHVGVACVGVGAVMLGIGYHLGYLLSSTTSSSSAAAVAARVLVVAANIIGTSIASSFLDKLGRKGLLPTSFSRMTVSSRSSGDGSFLMNVRSSDDVDIFARVIALKRAGLPQEMAQVLGEETKDLPQQKFYSLLDNIRLDEKHKKEIKRSRMVKWITYFLIVVCCFRAALHLIAHH